VSGLPIPLALASLLRRNRRRYGGYIVHLGLAVLLVGVAASSSFQHSTDLALAPGHHATVDGYTFRYLRPTSTVSDQRISLGAVLDVSKGGRHVTTLHTARGFYPSQDASLGVIGRFFGGEADSDVGLRTGLTRDIWTVVNPDLTPLQPVINQGNRVFQSEIGQIMTRFASRHVSAAQAQRELAPLWQVRDQAVAEIANRYVTHPWSVDFLMIVSPLVMWIWLGALIIAAGGLIALWPLPAPVRRRAPQRATHPSAPPSPATPVPVRELV
jgi:cytochrome c-type biogenesis protein CcmF